MDLVTEKHRPLILSTIPIITRKYNLRLIARHPKAGVLAFEYKAREL